MSVFGAFTVRDLVALCVIMSTTLRQGELEAPALVSMAFGVADQFVLNSTSKWATTARANHTTSHAQEKAVRRP